MKASVTLARANARSLPLANESVQCVLTSSPYWGLRNYDIESSIWDERRDCQHQWGPLEKGKRGDLLPADVSNFAVRIGTDERQNGSGNNSDSFCRICGAWRGQFGLEPTPALYVAHMVQICREVHRVLRSDGVFFLNLGDSFVTKPIGSTSTHDPKYPNGRNRKEGLAANRSNSPTSIGLKHKDLTGIPWRVALALQDDGWYLRSDMIWEKPNAMCDSTEDRPTRSHEYVFMLTKQPRYFYDFFAVREPCQSGPSDVKKMSESLPRIGGKHKDLIDPLSKASAATNIGRKRSVGDPSGRNMRSVLRIATEPFRGAHFATMPRALAAVCIKAGTSEYGCCPNCRAPYERILERTPMIVKNGPQSGGYGQRTTDNLSGTMEAPAVIQMLGWQPTCQCNAGDPIPCTVLDCFSGAGTSGVVSQALGRNYVGFDLSQDYLLMSRRRIERPHAPVQRNGDDEPFALKGLS